MKRIKENDTVGLLVQTINLTQPVSSQQPTLSDSFQNCITKKMKKAFHNQTLIFDLFQIDD